MTVTFEETTCDHGSIIGPIHTTGRKFQGVTWLGVCRCGRTFLIRTAEKHKSALHRGGRCSKCGTSAKRREPQFRTWQHMIARCSPRARARDRAVYADRGIAVCDRWRFGENGMSGFQCFIADMG